MSFEKDEDGNHKKTALLIIFKLYIVFSINRTNTEKKFQEKILLLDKKSIYYTNLHRKRQKSNEK